MRVGHRDNLRVPYALMTVDRHTYTDRHAHTYNTYICN